MEEVKKYADMSYIDFIKDVLKIKLTESQEILVKLYEENKTKKVEYINPYTIPLYKSEPYRPLTIYYDENHNSCDLVKTINGDNNTSKTMEIK